MNEEKQSPDKEGDGFTEFCELVTERCSEFFYDQFGTAFVVISTDEKDEALPINSRRFNVWLAKFHYDIRKFVATREKLRGVLSILEARAFYEGKEKYLFNRVGWHEGKLFYDLTDGKNAAVKVWPSGWDVTQAPLMFRRYSHQKLQVVPDIEAKPADIELLRPFVAVKESDWPLYKIWLVSGFVQGIPHPCPCPYGDQGSAKTFTSRITKKLIDPSLLEVTAIPRDKNDLILKLQHHWALFFDNVTGLNQETSDILCRAISGTALSKRQLYTDEDDVIFQFQRIVSLNGINIAPQQPDLLDRSILFEFERIPREKRKTEAALLNDFEIVKSKIMGAIFTILSKALEIRPTVKLRELPRMADFAEWGEAISQALGYEQGFFMTAYNQNICRQNTEAIGASVLGECILSLMASGSEWSGSPSQLLDALESEASKLRINTKTSAWPKAPNSLTRRLNVIKVNLAEIGLYVNCGKSGERSITIGWKISSKTPEPPKFRESPHNHKNLGNFTDDTKNNISAETSNTVQSSADDNEKYRPNTAKEDSVSKDTLNHKILDIGRLVNKDDIVIGDCITKTVLSLVPSDVITLHVDIISGLIKSGYTKTEAERIIKDVVSRGIIHEVRPGFFRRS